MDFGIVDISPEISWMVPSLISESRYSWDNWLPLAGDIMVPLISTLVGASIAIYVAQATRRHTEYLELTKQVRIEKAQWYTLMHKAAIVASDLDSIGTWIVGSLERANTAGLTSERLWQRLSGLAGVSVAVQIDPADFVPLIEAGEYDLIAAFNELVAQNSVMASSVAYYTERRSGLADRIKRSKSFSGSLLLSALSVEDQEALEPHMAELDTLAAQIRDRIPSLVRRANKLVEDLGPAGKKYFKDPNFRTMKMSPVSGVSKAD